MRCDIPVLNRFCFCFPLRRGLLVLAYLKLILSTSILSLMIWRANMVHSHYRASSTRDYLLTAIPMAIVILDILFVIFFIISTHKMDYRKMRIFYRYSIFLLGLVLVGLLLFLGINFYQIGQYRKLEMGTYFIKFTIVHFMIPVALLLVTVLVFQGYLIILVRSEVLELKSNTRFEFKNCAMEAEARCTAHVEIGDPQMETY